MLSSLLEKYRMNRIRLVKADITQLEIDAIVNAANNSLLGGGGVDGAIHKAAGFALLRECKSLNGCATGEAKITKGYNLPAKHVIHTVGPVYRNHTVAEAHHLLSMAYKNSLQLAKKHKLKTVAFPNISTGVYGFPLEEAASVAIATVLEFIENNQTPQQVIFCFYEEDNFKLYEHLLNSESN